MKMIILMVKDQLTETLTAALTGAQYRVTRIASTGGFLRSGTTTMLIGVEEAQVDAAVSLIRSVGGRHARGRPASHAVRRARFALRADLVHPAPAIARAADVPDHRRGSSPRADRSATLPLRH